MSDDPESTEVDPAAEAALREHVAGDRFGLDLDE